MSDPGKKPRGDEPASFEDLADEGGDVERMEHRQRSAPSTPGPARPGESPPSQESVSQGPGTGLHVPDRDEPLKARQSWVTPARFKRLCRGDVAFQSSIDLHGSRLAAAKRRVHEGLRGAAASGQECVRIVTGKGHHSEDGVARLREALPGWLGDPELGRTVAAFAPAQEKDGGRGAVYVLLG